MVRLADRTAQHRRIAVEKCAVSRTADAAIPTHLLGWRHGAAAGYRGIVVYRRG